MGEGSNRHRRHLGKVAASPRFRLFLSILAASLAAMGATAFTAAAEPVGLFLTGEKSAEEAKQPKFAAEKYVASVAGASTTTNAYKLQYGTAECSGVQPSSEISAPASQLSMNWIYGLPCAFVFPSPIRQNGCSIVLHVNNAGPLMSGAQTSSVRRGKESNSRPPPPG